VRRRHCGCACACDCDCDCACSCACDCCRSCGGAGGCCRGCACCCGCCCGGCRGGCCGRCCAGCCEGCRGDRCGWGSRCGDRGRSVLREAAGVVHAGDRSRTRARASARSDGTSGVMMGFSGLGAPSARRGADADGTATGCRTPGRDSSARQAHARRPPPFRRRRPVRRGLRQPDGVPVCDSGRSPGSRDLMRRLPMVIPQWLQGAPALAYRCGGSTGLNPSRPGRVLHRFPV
jgi:hypothetical protein